VAAFAVVSADGEPLLFCVVLPPPHDAIVSARARRVGMIVGFIVDVFLFL
jgi:hypothetical protein